MSRTFSGEVTIDRPIGDVYEFYVDLRNLPSFLGDVVAVRRDSDKRYTWTVLILAKLRMPMTVEVSEAVTNEKVSYHTLGPVRATWTVTFESTSPTQTRVRERLSGPMGPPMSWMMAAVGKHPEGEVTNNLVRLKELLEDGRVTNMRNTARGKFR